MTDPRDSDSAFGVLDFLAWDNEKFGNHYNPQEIERSIALMQEAGVAFIRMDFLWEDIEPQGGRFQFAKYDGIVNQLIQHDIRVEGILAYTPPWSGKAWNHAPELVSYCRYARAVVDHFKDRVRHWEIWHEPDNPDFWQPQDNMRAYVQLLKSIYPLLKAVDPTCLIHLGGMSRSLPMSLKNVYQEGGREFFDVFNFHPFTNPLIPGAFEAVRHLHKIIFRIMTEYGDREKPIWFTEIGCPGMQDPHSSKNWWLGANPDEQAQAGWVRTIYNQALQLDNVQKIFWCFFRDTTNHFKCGSDYDGLIRHDFSKKPSFEAYRELAAQPLSSKPLT